MRWLICRAAQRTVRQASSAFWEITHAGSEAGFRPSLRDQENRKRLGAINIPDMRAEHRGPTSPGQRVFKNLSNRRLL
ncbi:hypothetical protein NHX12_012294 [Muraenolepis orangiensis]|uniref:Uncharacterized protein n=1 Tax=Muraenolepis orangiensis TaxID=630683 RepID=A0A9Q0DDV7_9TELE|nr:hypothetical protein NHX12_012294 [Muraenolepis orangiensis]